MSGESRNDAAQRRRERAERLARFGTPHGRSEAARATERALRELPAGWSVLHDVTWPGRRGATIDHVVVGPAGVFVIASQAWSGWVTVHDDVLHEDGRARERAVASAAEAALQVGQMTGRLSVTQPMLCFAEPRGVTGRSREVLLGSTDTLVGALVSRPAVLAADQVRQLAREMELHLAAAAAALGPSVPRPRGKAEDSALPVLPPRIRVTGEPLRVAAVRGDDGRDREGRERVLRIVVLVLVVAALVATILLADDLGGLLARLLA